MFKSFLEDTKKAAEKLTKEALNRFINDRIAYLNELKKKILNSLKSGKYLKEAPLYERLITQVTKEAPDIVFSEIEKAVRLNREFNHEFFLSKLKIATKDPRLYKISFDLNTAKLNVDLDFNTVAGSTEDYVRGIKEFRSKLQGQRKLRSSGPMALHFWREKYYGTAREGRSVTRTKKSSNKEIKKIDITAKLKQAYWYTMTSRVFLSGKLAPFWQILDKGFSVIGVSSDNQPYPINNPTWFVFTSIRKIKARFWYLISQEMKKTGLNIEDPQGILDEIDQTIVEINKLRSEIDPKKVGTVQLNIITLINKLRNIEITDTKRVIQLAENFIRTGRIASGKQERVRIKGLPSGIRTKILEALLRESLEYR